MLSLAEKLQLAERAARTSGEMLLAHPHTPARHKAENDFVTEMDIKSEELIRSILLSECPEDSFLGEEEGEQGHCRGRWIVDPIDGTANFFKGFPTYTISIAYELDGDIKLGCVFCPYTNEMWTGLAGGGAYLNGKPIHVSDESVPRNSFLHISFCHRVDWANEYVMARLHAVTRAYSDLRRNASAAYDLCSVATGRAEGFFELCIHNYDIAAGVIILREAGGVVTGWRDGEDALITGNVLATNGKIHEHLRGILLSGDHSSLDKHMPLC